MSATETLSPASAADSTVTRRVAPAVDARAAVFELVKIDLERRWKSGDRPRIEEYLTRDVRLGAAAEVPNISTALGDKLRSVIGCSAPLRTVLGSIFTSAPL